MNMREYCRVREHVDFDAVNAAARVNFLAVLRRLLPDGKVIHREFVARNPRRNDRHPGSFSVNIATGKWADFAADAKGGDPISFVAYIEGASRIEAARLLGQMLAIKSEERGHG